MQRSISHKKPLEVIVYILLFVLYSSLSTIYPYLPPLFAVLFLLFTRALEKQEVLNVLIVSLCLVVFEANNGYFLFSSILYFYIVYKLIMPKILQNFSCSECIKIFYVLFAYVGFYLFLLLLSNVFLLPRPELSYYIVYYIVIEFFLVSLI